MSPLLASKPPQASRCLPPAPHDHRRLALPGRCPGQL